MAKTNEKDRVKRWQERVAAANRVYEAWELKYECKLLEQYYLGHQWRGIEDDIQRYVINLIFPTIETRLPSLLYYYPYYRVNPRVGRSDDPKSEIQERAKLREDTLNSVVSEPDFAFLEETSLGLIENYFRFCVVELGYSADYVDNPEVGKPALKEGKELIDKSGQAVLQGPYKLESESLYIKRIPAKSFRASANQHNRMERCDWVGYYEWHYPEDLKKNKRYRNTSSIKATGKIPDGDHQGDDESHKDMVKIWKLWSLRSDKARVVFPEAGEKFLLEETWDIFPLEGLKFHEIPDQWYPLPAVFNWLSPQDELNEVREMQKRHRRRANRRYQYVAGGVEEDELDKLEDQDKDFQLVKVNYDNAIKPIEDAPLDGAIERAVPNSKEDLREMSGEGGEQMGISASDTATQANIIDVRARIRENFDRVKVAKFLGRVGKKLLQLMELRMNLDLWIKRNVDPFGTEAQAEAQRITHYYQQINVAAQFGELDCDVTVDVESLSPVTQDAEREAFNQALVAITNPAVAMLFVADQSGVLLTKFLKYYRITNQREVQAIRDALHAMALSQAQSAPGAGGSPQGAGPGPTPTNPQIQGQLAEQMPVGGVM